MDDLVGGFLLLLLLALAVAAAIAAFTAATVVGGVIVGLLALVRFLHEFARRVATRGGAARQPAGDEPAYELYVLGQLRRDVRHAGEHAWAGMAADRRSADDFAGGLGDGFMMPLAFGIMFGALAGTGVGVVICAIVVIPVAAVAGVIIAGAWALIGVLRLFELVRRRVRRTSYECPVDHERFPLPVYVCPACGAEHRQLVPGRWGIFKRECQCGRVMLPTMVLNGRQRVPQRCPDGHEIAGIIGFAEPVRLALVAGPSAGKTTFLAGVLQELETLSTSGTMALGVVEGSRKHYQRALDELRHGKLPAKTVTGSSPTLVAEVQGDGRSRVLSLYDVSGESYTSEDARRGLRFLEVPSGLILLVDPLALERFAVDHEEELRQSSELRPSPVGPARVVEGVLGSLAEAGAVTERIPVAVVVTKADALDVGGEIRSLAGAHGDRAVPEWLEQQGAGNLVRMIEGAFKRVGWFHASALGRTPISSDTSPFVPQGTADPVLWLLGQNGVTPSARPFVASQHADRLDGAGAADFPLLTNAGWARRAVPSLGVALAITVALAWGATSVVRSLDLGSDGGVIAEGYAPEDDGSFDPNAAPAAAEEETEPSTRTFRRDAFSIEIPRSWVVRERDDQRSGYIENRWTPASTREVLFKVNHTPGLDRSAAFAARSVRAMVKDRDSYVELDWSSARVNGRPAWRWEFMLDNRHKVDYFMSDDCGTGFAMLGQTTPGRWDRYVETFEQIVQSIEPTC